jgi:hypothetical protein
MVISALLWDKLGESELTIWLPTLIKYGAYNRTIMVGDFILFLV